jgi:hypothetical protein
MGARIDEDKVNSVLPTVLPPVNLLWTGGWDSSFRLLQLLLQHRREVIPHYLLDPTRASTQAELEAMQRIRDSIFEEHPHTRALLHPLRKFDIASLAPDAAITDAFRKVASKHFIGSQYDWLARFCKQLGIAELELAAGHRGGRIQGIIGSLVMRTTDSGQVSYRIDPQHSDTNEFIVFGGFSFPLFELNKQETGSIAAERGWLDILRMSWFCHKPGPGNEPCGYCNPCLYAVDEGFGWRISRRNRIKGIFYRALVRPMKAPAKAALGRLGIGRRP